ncbi:hypothetical protein ACS7SF_19080 (plasmid) [Ralstonia sp. 25C]|uniref:hypothetical protein n=1 Tax=Ralstonia sp. 25C TaxID=3447363 RepID=UPI003F754DFA
MRVAGEMSIAARLLSKDEGCAYIASVFSKFNPWKREGHVSIGDDVKKLRTEDCEFSFSRSMRGGPAFIFFEQNQVNRCDVVVVEDARNISLLMKNGHGMEYFISDNALNYLIAVNWYVIEYVGDVELSV